MRRMQAAMTRARSRSLRFAAGAALLTAFTASSAESQTLFGGRIGAYTDQEDLFLGAEVLTPVADRLYLNPNVEYVLADRANQATFNFDLHYDFARRGFATFWFGGGLGLLYFDPDAGDSSTDVGANLLFGVGFRQQGVIPYVQAKGIIAGDDRNELVIGFGLRF